MIFTNPLIKEIKSEIKRMQAKADMAKKKRTEFNDMGASLWAEQEFYKFLAYTEAVESLKTILNHAKKGEK